MATTRDQVHAGIAYHTTRAQIYAQLDAVKALMAQHEVQAKTEGTHWGHVGDLTEVLGLLQRITTPVA